MLLKTGYISWIWECLVFYNFPSALKRETPKNPVISPFHSEKYLFFVHTMKVQNESDYKAKLNFQMFCNMSLIQMKTSVMMMMNSWIVFWTGGSLVSLWRSAMCSAPAREKGQALLHDLVLDPKFPGASLMSILTEMTTSCWRTSSLWQI